MQQQELTEQQLRARSLSDYLRVTLAPSASSLALASSAEALSSCSLITFGAPSTASLASLSPRPVISRTTLITLTLFGPTSVSSTSNSVFSSAAAPSAPAAATTTPRANSICALALFYVFIARQSERVPKMPEHFWDLRS